MWVEEYRPRKECIVTVSCPLNKIISSCVSVLWLLCQRITYPAQLRSILTATCHLSPCSTPPAVGGVAVVLKSLLPHLRCLGQCGGDGWVRGAFPLVLWPVCVLLQSNQEASGQQQRERQEEATSFSSLADQVLPSSGLPGVLWAYKWSWQIRLHVHALPAFDVNFHVLMMLDFRSVDLEILKVEVLNLDWHN